MNAADQVTLKTAIDELGNDLPLARKIVEDYKKGGWKNVLAQDGATLALEARKDYAAIAAAIPVVKSGWRTSEFWGFAGFLLVNAVLFLWKGITLPSEVNIAIAALLGVFTVVRAAIKAKHTDTVASAIAAVVAAPVATPIFSGRLESTTAPAPVVAAPPTK